MLGDVSPPLSAPMPGTQSVCPGTWTDPGRQFGGQSSLKSGKHMGFEENPQKSGGFGGGQLPLCPPPLDPPVPGYPVHPPGYGSGANGFEILMFVKKLPHCKDTDNNALLSQWRLQRHFPENMPSEKAVPRPLNVDSSGFFCLHHVCNIS